MQALKKACSSKATRLKTSDSVPLQLLPYASSNWIRFQGSDFIFSAKKAPPQLDIHFITHYRPIAPQSPR
jgi:hypothetical protein